MEQPLPAERHRRIHELLREQRVVRVSVLSEQLGVSEVTIRRDLEVLERRGMLERTHGGAVATQWVRSEPAYRDAASTNPIEKRLIGAAAAALVEQGDALYLNGGTTTLQVFRHLRATGLKVATNHVGIALEAADRDVELLLLGGHYRAPSNSVVGPFATEALRRTHATKAFIGVEGISVGSGLTTPVAAEAEIARVMIEQTRGRVLVVADHSKIGTVADFVIAPLEEVDALVVDEGCSEAYRQRLTEAGIEVIVAAERASAVSGEGLSGVRRRRGERMSMSDQAARDTADLEKFGYKQELNRGLGTFSSFAVAFSYISPSTGIFTLFGLGMAAMGAYLFWAWPVVALFQFVVALNFAELSSHFPVAGSVYQWTKYLAGPEATRGSPAGST